MLYSYPPWKNMGVNIKFSFFYLVGRCWHSTLHPSEKISSGGEMWVVTSHKEIIKKKLLMGVNTNLMKKSCVGGIPWEQSHVGGIPWEQFCVGEILCGRNTVGGIPWGEKTMTTGREDFHPPKNWKKKNLGGDLHLPKNWNQKKIGNEDLHPQKN